MAFHDVGYESMQTVGCPLGSDGKARSLIIIGNGFDLYHGLATGCCDYGEWLSKNDASLFEKYERFDYLQIEDNTQRWSNLEKSLSIRWEDLCDEVLENTYPNIGDDRPGWDDFGIGVAERLDFLEAFTGARFREWVQSIDISQTTPCLRFPTESVFVTFNYAALLEHCYGINPDRILHVHGSVLEDSKPLQFGSPTNNPGDIALMLESKYGTGDLYGASIKQGVHAAAGCGGHIWKNIPGNYSALKDFLGRCGPIDNVCIMGNTFDGVDGRYYREVPHPCLGDVEWVFCGRELNDGKKDRIERFCKWMRIDRFKMCMYEDFSVG